MADNYELTITYTLGREIASWDFNNQGAKKCCTVDEGDFVTVKFNGPGDLGESVMLCGQMDSDKPSSPFIQGNQINLKNTPVLQVGELPGRWGFSIAFTARNADGTSSFYYVPDPELIVGTRPGSDD